MKRCTACVAFAWVFLLVGSAAGDDPQGDRPTVEHSTLIVTGSLEARYRPFDELMVRFVREHQVPGAALAVARGDQVVFARGYGKADLDRGSPVYPESLFRIASLSKPITAVAILQLVEQGRLRLEDRVFELLKVVPHFEAGRTEIDPRLARITVRHLLQHTAGWDRDQSFDPMFQSVRIAESLGEPPPASAEMVIRFMAGQPLDFDPGERYAYSNFGYCLLGRIIEQVSGEPYEQYVRERVFAPLGCVRPRIGKTRRRSSWEVRYFANNDAHAPSVFAADLGQPVPDAYGAWHLEAMDAHGGWIASAVDLVRFSVAVHRGTEGGLLSDASRDALFERPEGLAGYDEDGQPRDFYYGLGWVVRPTNDSGAFNSWHTGSLPGTSTLLVHRHDGWHWAVLFNTRDSADGRRLSNVIDPLLHQAANQVE